jgi:hypothetical protein
MTPALALSDRRGFGFWFWLLAVVTIAAIVRLIFFRGMMGSDDFVYYDRAAEISSGLWSSSDYVGAIRYGVNIPVAAVLALLGPGVFVATLFPLLCSLAEIGVVALVARPALGDRTALLAALLMAFAPIHIDRATYVHADSILALAITLTFALFWRGERSGRLWPYLAAGLSAGYAYWVKEVCIVFLAALVLYAIVMRQWSWSWLYVAVGALAMFLLNSVLMWAVAGDPLHVLSVVREQVQFAYFGQQKPDSPAFYFRYLLFDVRHTWLIAYLAIVGGAYLAVRRRALGAEERQFGDYVALWLVGMLSVFSLLPISVDPLRLIAKQSNYLSMFVAPLALLGAIGLASMGRWLRWGASAAFVFGGFVLGALGQQDLRAFVANSQAAEDFAATRPAGTVYGTGWNANVSRFHAVLRSSAAEARVRAMRELKPIPGAVAVNAEAYVVLDRQTLGRSQFDVALTAAPACWRSISGLEPQGYGFGADVTRVAVSLARRLPGPLGQRAAAPFERLLHPAPAEVYTVPPADPWCGTVPRGLRDRSTDVRG